MSYDSNGTFIRVHNWEQDRINNIEIVSDRHDQEDDNFAEGLSQCVLRDGRAAMTGDLNMNNLNIRNLADAAVSTDAVNKGQLDLKADDSTVVHLAGSEMITGIKTFACEFNVANSGYTTRVVQQVDGNFVIYKDNVAILSSGASSSKILEAPSNAGTTGTHSVVTNQSVSFSQNGYFELSNGLIVQWGHETRNSSGTTTINYPKAFSGNDSYKIVANPTKSVGDNSYSPTLISKSTQQASFYLASPMDGIDWIAIGY